MKKSDTAFLLATLVALNMTTAVTAQPTGAPVIIDENGSHIVLKEMRHQSGPEWRDYGKTVLDYDALGNNTLQQFLTHDGEDAWKERYSVEYEYDFAGQVLTFVTRYAAEESAQDQRNTYTYSDNGRLLEAQFFIPENEGWRIKGRARYAYDNQGRELTHTWQDALPDDSWRTSKEVEFIYDDEEATTTEILKHADESDVIIILGRKLTTRNGSEVTALSQSYRGSDEWENVTLRTSTEDQSGKEVAWTSAYWLNGEWSFNYRFRTMPSDEPNVSVTVDETFNGTEWMPTSRTTTISRYGVPEIVADEVFEAGEWRNGTRMVYLYEPLTPLSTDPGGSLAEGFTLLGNYPNPFNPSTTLRYEMQQAAHVSISVFDVTGRQVAVIVNGAMPAGSHEAIFEAGNLPSGTYVAHMSVGGRTSVRPMMLVK